MYKLDKIDKLILFELDKNCRIPDTTLAKIVGKSKESVRYRIKQLREYNIIEKFTIWIDPTKLGFRCAKIYLTLANKPLEKKKFIEFVKKDKRLFWLGIAEGAWNAGLTYFVTSNEEFFDLKNELFSQFKDLILDNHTANIVGVYIDDKKFFHNYDESAWKTLFAKEENFQLEDLEKNILKDLFNNGRISLAELAQKNKTSIDIVRLRIKKLEEKKIIFKYTIQVNYPKLHYEFFKTFLYFKNLMKNDEVKFIEYCRKQERIIHLVKQISPWDMELEIMCDDYNQYNQILNELTEGFAEIIKKVETALISEDYIFPAEKMIFQ